jgi:hypothetical protein
MKKKQTNIKKNSNDEVIAVFFRKSITVIFIIVILVMVIYYFVNQKPKQQIVAEKKYQAPSELTKIVEPPDTQFNQEAEKRGLDFVHYNGATGERMLPETMGSGVAFIDYDNDGDQDLVFANGTNWPWDESLKQQKDNATQQIFTNNGQGYFSNDTKVLGLADSFYGTGIAIGDINNDGYDDIFFAAVGKNTLYINQAGKKFQQSEINLDCTEDGWSSSAGFFDYDNDGDLDLMVLNYVKWSRELDLAADYKIDGIGRAYGPPSNFPGSHNCLFENQMNQSSKNFVDVTKKSGIIIKNNSTNDYVGKSLALIFLDINLDGWQDVIVANDTTRNFVYVNQKNNTFDEQGEQLGLAYNDTGKATGAMGLDSAYYKNDADLAVTVGNFANEMTSFFVNRAEMGFFTDESVLSGIGPESRLALSFGLFFFDYDLDGRLDFFQTNGHVENNINKVQSAQHYAQKSQLFWNCGNDCDRTFLPVKQKSDITQIDIVGRAAVYGDIDNDGDLDVIVTQVAGRPKLYINQSQVKNWIGIRLLNQGKTTLGSKITVKGKNGTQIYTYSTTKSYLSQFPKGQIIGIGDDKTIEIVVDYIGGSESFSQLKINNWNTISLEY